MFRNQGGRNSWLKVKLNGDGQAVNRSAIGAQVRVKVGDKILTRHVDAGTGEGNQNDTTLHFGLGNHKGPVGLEVFWPNKATQSMADLGVNELVTIDFKGKS